MSGTPGSSWQTTRTTVPDEMLAGRALATPPTTMANAALLPDPGRTGVALPRFLSRETRSSQDAREARDVQVLSSERAPLGSDSILYS
jgi:hypothetical protein